MLKQVLILSVAATSLLISSCKSNGDDPKPKKEITINPASANVSAGGTVQFTLTGNAAGEAVTWSLDQNVGSISNSGLYTAPSSISANTSVIVTATLQSDNTVKSTATVNINVAPISFSNQILPILSSNCTGCHGGSFPSGNYRTNSHANVMLGGNVIAGEPHNSELYLKITSSTNPMPPAPNPKLSAASIELIRLWIEQGAKNN